MPYPHKNWSTEGYPRRKWVSNDTHFHKLVVQESIFEFDYQLLGYVELLPDGWTVIKYHPGALMSEKIGRYNTLDDAKAALIAVVCLEDSS